MALYYLPELLADYLGVKANAVNVMTGNPTIPSASTGAGTGAPSPAFNGTVVDFVSQTPDFSTLLSAVQIAGLGDALKGGNLTVLAPTNEAFAQIKPRDLKALLANPTKLASVLKQHVVPGNVRLKEGNSFVKNLDGGESLWSVTKDEDGNWDIYVDQSKVQGIVRGNNWTALAIDRVLGVKQEHKTRC